MVQQFIKFTNDSVWKLKDFNYGFSKDIKIIFILTHIRQLSGSIVVYSGIADIIS